LRRRTRQAPLAPSGRRRTFNTLQANAVKVVYHCVQADLLDAIETGHRRVAVRDNMEKAAALTARKIGTVYPPLALTPPPLFFPSLVRVAATRQPERTVTWTVMKIKWSTGRSTVKSEWRWKNAWYDVP